MTRPSQDISEDELQAYVDGRLGAERRAAVADYLEHNPDEMQRIRAYQQQNALLHGLFDPVLDEPVPERVTQPPRRRLSGAPLRYAAMAASVVVGVALGWGLHGAAAPPPALLAMDLPQQAAIAHVVYTPEVRHPVEVGADQETHLVGWLSKRLGADLHPPQLAQAGYSLMGGRLLPGEHGPAAQFMYQDNQGNRLTLYVRKDADGNRETAFRYAEEGPVHVFYWIDGPLGYALSGEVDKAQLLRVADSVYQQLTP